MILSAGTVTFGEDERVERRLAIVYISTEFTVIPAFHRIFLIAMVDGILIGRGLRVLWMSYRDRILNFWRRRQRSVSRTGRVWNSLMRGLSGHVRAEIRTTLLWNEVTICDGWLLTIELLP